MIRSKLRNNPVDTGHKLNVLCTFSLRPVSSGKSNKSYTCVNLQTIESKGINVQKF